MTLPIELGRQDHINVLGLLCDGPVCSVCGQCGSCSAKLPPHVERCECPRPAHHWACARCEMKMDALTVGDETGPYAEPEVHEADAPASNEPAHAQSPWKRRGRFPRS